MQETLAAVAVAPHSPIELRTLHLDDPHPNEVLVEVKASGICHSDLSGRDQTLPFGLPGVLGHEGVGLVRAVGDKVTRVQVGDRVLMSQAFCGECEACVSGRVMACPHTGALAIGGSRPDGTTFFAGDGAEVSGGYLGQSSWASHAVAREANVVRLPDDLPWEVASPMACGVQTGAGGVLNMLKPGGSDSMVVFGAGAVGLSAAMAAKHLGCETIVVVDPIASRRDLAEELGATHAVDPTSGDPVQAVKEITGGGADFCVEASGSRAAGAPAVHSLNTYGTCLLLGVVPYGTMIELDWMGFVSGRKVLGAPFGGGTPAGTIDDLLAMRDAGALPVEKLVRTYAFADIEQAISDMEAGVTIKPVLLFD